MAIITLFRSRKRILKERMTIIWFLGNHCLSPGKRKRSEGALSLLIVNQRGLWTPHPPRIQCYQSRTDQLSYKADDIDNKPEESPQNIWWPGSTREDLPRRNHYVSSICRNKSKQDHLRMNSSTGSNNHLKSRDQWSSRTLWNQFPAEPSDTREVASLWWPGSGHGTPLCLPTSLNCHEFIYHLSKSWLLWSKSRQHTATSWAFELYHLRLYSLKYTVNISCIWRMHLHLDLFL